MEHPDSMEHFCLRVSSVFYDAYLIVVLQIIFCEVCPEMRLFKSELLFAMKDFWFLGKVKTENKKTLEREKKKFTYISLSSAANKC